jgi:hypothetical protein
MIPIMAKSNQPGKQGRAILTLDTSRGAERMQVQMWRRMTPLEKSRAVSDLSLAVRNLSFLGIRQRFPNATDNECRLRYAILTLGRELAVLAYPEIASLRDA